MLASVATIQRSVSSRNASGVYERVAKVAALMGRGVEDAAGVIGPRARLLRALRAVLGSAPVSDQAATAAGGITLEELQLAARNHALPLEALRYPITPVGLHYLLIHFDIPRVDVDTWRLEIGGRVARPLTLSLEEIEARPARTIAVTMECAGNGRALYEPRALSQPWLLEAVGTAEWTGTPLAPILEEAGVEADALEVVFTGL